MLDSGLIVKLFASEDLKMDARTAFKFIMRSVYT